MEGPAPAAVTTSGWTGRHAVELYVRTYSTMLQSSGEIRLDSVVHAHLGMASALHPLAAGPQMDMGAFLYAVRRLPRAIMRGHRVIMGQSPQGFRAALGLDVAGWERVKAAARRRPWYYDGKETLAVLIASQSDIDDLVPTLVAFQIEWNKLHRALREVGLDPERVREEVKASRADWNRLREAWGDEFESNLAWVRDTECHISLRMLGGSHVGYARSASRWWVPIQAAIDEMGLTDAQIYFVSSNIHSLVNVLSGVARIFEREIVEHTQAVDPDLTRELQKVEAGETRASRDNWLYYGARSLFDRHPEAAELRGKRAEMEQAVGIRHVPPPPMGIASAGQIIKLSDLDPACPDPRIGAVDPAALAGSKAAIVNIDYPLGLGAYHLLR